jgi:UDP-N-acetylglucosamine acyltransferase
MIHPTAIIGKEVKLGSNVKVGPYVFIDGNVSIGIILKYPASSSITGNTNIGENNKIFPFCSIGSIPQDLKYYGEEVILKIGDSNTFRELLYCKFWELKEVDLTHYWKISLYDWSTYSS